MTQFRLYLFVIAIIAFSSCSDDFPNFDTNDKSEGVEGYFFVLYDEVSNSRVSYNGNSSKFEEGDILGIFSLNSTDIAIGNQNVPYRVKNVVNLNPEKPSRQVLEPVNQDVTADHSATKFVIYYPYNKEITDLSEIKNLSHTVKSGQSEQDNYEASDLLWDVATPNADHSCVNIAMDHAMANIIVEISPEFIDIEKNIELSIDKLKATDINLTIDDVNNLKYKVTTATDDIHTIRMLRSGYSNKGHVFKAAVPAQTIAKDTELITVTRQDGSLKKYSLVSDMSMKPGYNYRFVITKKDNDVTPEVGEDDSWVLDVLDPETGKPVGLLCREYLRYQPDLVQNDNMKVGKTTGTIPTTRDFYGNETRNINSQAWVFYNLQEDGITPELSEGTILRFVYDIIYEAGKAEYNERGVATWPLPHHKTSQGIVQQIILAVKHGHTWVEKNDGEGIYGTNSQEYENYYMHGGKIIWDPVNNVIADFQMPKVKIDNEFAYENAHISIPKEGKPYVSFSRLDEETEKIGFIIPHNLIDKRLAEDKKTLIIKTYPMVKIGFNKFWMSKSLRATTAVDGTPLKCYNKNGEPGLTFKKASEDNNILDPGYLFTYKEIPEEEKSFDPYNEFSISERELLQIPPLYNYPAFEQGLLLPKSDEGNNEYYMPSITDTNRFIDYFGFVFPAKISNSGLRTKKGSEHTESLYDALVAGKWVHPNCDLYTANISGFNLKAIGLKHDITDDFDIGGTASFLLKTDNRDKGISYVKFNSWNCWSASEFSGFYVGQDSNYGYEYPKGSWQREESISRLFSQVRFFMSYKNQKDTSGITSLASFTKSRTYPSPLKEIEHINRNIFVPLTE